MDLIRIHPHALKHDLSQEEISFAWHNFARKRPRGDDCWVTIGFTGTGREVEMVGIILADGTWRFYRTSREAGRRPRGR